MVSNEKELEEILKKTKSSSLSLKELSELYFRTKEKIFSREEITRTEVLIATNIFLNGYINVGEYLSGKEMKNLTDEELEVLLSLCDEASVNFNYLTELFFSGDDEKLSSVFSQESNEEKQKNIESVREDIVKEKARRKVQRENNGSSENNQSKIDGNVNELLNESLKKRTGKLQKEVVFLRSKNKSKEADKLQERINKIKNPEKNPEKNPNFLSLNSLLIGFGLALVIGFIVFLVIRARKNK